VAAGAVGVFNYLLTGLFDLLFYPFRALDPIWALLAISLLTGILMLWLFGKVSDQEVIKVVRDRIRGNLIAIRLFGDNLRLLGRLQGRVLRQTLTFLRHAFVPMLVLLVPVLLILIQLNLRFAERPLEPDEIALVKVEVRDPAVFDQRLTLEAPEGITVETPVVRARVIEESFWRELFRKPLETRPEVSWRIRADAPGRYQLVVHVGGEAVEKELLVGTGWGATPARRTGKGFLDLLLWPGEPPIDAASPVARIEVTYPALDLALFGWGMNWIVFFFVVSILFGYACRRPLGVEI
jgi:uncharacterized membrane protein (DUF106 family)